MASQKRTRTASSGQARSGGTAARSGSGSSGNRGGTRPADRGQNGRTQNGRGPNGRGQNGRGGSVGIPAQGRPGTLTTGSPAGQVAIPFSAPTWLQWTSLGLSLAGLGISIYMTIAHYTTTAILVCSSNGYVNCAKVTTSPESMVFNIFPVAVLGLVFYFFMTAVNTPWAWRSGIALIWWARLAGIVTGMGFVLYLIYAEVVQIRNICLDCTSVHVITFLLFGLLIFAATLRLPTSDDPR
jgi:uncharacterized membrane protein